MTVVGIGQCCWDILAEVNAYPEADEKEEIWRMTEEGGGPTATALVTLTRLGIPCRFHGIVGDDGYAGKIRDSLAREGIDITGLVARGGAASQVAFIAIERLNGRRTIFWQRPTGRGLQPDELAAGFLEGAAALHLDGLMPEVSRHALDEARRAGIPVMVDAGRLRPGMAELAARCDYLVAAERFFLDLGWDGSEEGFQRIASALGSPVATVSRGARGSMTWSGGECFATPAFPVAAVDTTGAGDAFHGGYLYGILQGWELRRTVTFASAVAALGCRSLGGRAGIPTLAGTMLFLEEQGASPG
jgi:sulfofructose kinase